MAPQKGDAMKWLLVTWYIVGGYPWTTYEFDSKETCEAARDTMIKHQAFTSNYEWFCVHK